MNTNNILSAALLHRYAPAGLVLAMTCAHIGAETTVTFLVTSDSHYDAFESEDRNQRNRATIDHMNEISTVRWPKALGGGLIKKPRGVLLLGDVIDDGDRMKGGENQSEQQYRYFLTDFGLDGTDGRLKVPVFEGWGNHDGPPEGRERFGFSFQSKLKARNAVRLEHRLIDSISKNGLHYSWNWGGVHFVQLNLYPGNRPHPKTRYSPQYHDPQESLDFLQAHLSAHARPGDTPVVVVHHYDLQGSDWWHDDERNAYYDAIRPHNVVAVFHGHTGTGVYKWKPDGEEQPLTVVNTGQTENGFFVVEISADRIRLAYRIKEDNRKVKQPDGKEHWEWDGAWGWRNVYERDFTASRVRESTMAATQTAVTAEEMESKDAWVKAHLLKPAFTRADSSRRKASRSPEPGLDVYANNDPVIPNSRDNRPLRIGKKSYTRGLYCHAVSKVVVTLPRPGKRFTAEIGLDYNDDTLHGRGSVVFSVTVDNRVAFKSDVMNVHTPAKHVDVDLKGARSFILEIGDAGDGIGWDQSNWADAKVVLDNGRELWLGEMALRDKRRAVRLKPIVRSSALPFAFFYGDTPSDGLLSTWPKRLDTTQLTKDRTRHTLTWSDSQTGMEVRCVAVEYADFPAIEWTLYFKNNGQSKTPILQNIQALDISLERAAAGEFILHAQRGDTCAPNLYQPLKEKLEPNKSLHFAPAGGRGTNSAFPYYKLQMPGGGLLLAVGWPGQWASSFVRDAGCRLRLSAGQDLTYLYLEPGEEIRSPLIALVFWKGEDTVRAQNLWRRWMWAHNVPRTRDGKLPPPILFGNTSAQFHEMIHANETNQKYFIDRYGEEGIRIDFWWMDAGWYPCGGHWPSTGTWEPDTTRFPGGLRAISDHALGKGIKTLVWFEPERVGGGWLSRNHPEWRIGPLLNLGHPGAWRWLVDHVDVQLKNQGIHLYRQDFNMDPLGYWRGNDAPDRQGITENLHVQGYLAYWDELRKRHPQLIIDSCASGGRRNDLETMRRAVPLHPTDYNYANLTVKQAFHHSLFQWIPYYGSNTVPIDRIDPYAIRSGHALGVVFGYDMRREDLNYGLLRKLAAQWRQAVDCFYGDFYPLSPYSIEEEKWIAWQFHHPQRNEGVVQAFRRERSDALSKTFSLGGLDPEAHYRVTDLDREAPVTSSGRALLEDGLAVKIPNRPGAVMIRYAEVRGYRERHQ